MTGPPASSPALLDPPPDAISANSFTSAGGPGGDEQPLGPEPLVGDFGDYEMTRRDRSRRDGCRVRGPADQPQPARRLENAPGGEARHRRDLHRFRNEAEAVAGLDHPHIVPIYEVGEHDGRPYFSMKLIDGRQPGGGSARPHPSRPRPGSWPRRPGRPPRPRAGILHRDLKPGQRPARRRRPAARRRLRPGQAPRGATAARRTAGAIVGTPSYMAPEQAAGRKDLDSGGRRLRPGRDALRHADRPPAFRGETPWTRSRKSGSASRCRRACSNPQRGPRPGDDLPEVPGEAAATGATQRRGDGRRPGAFLAGEPIVARSVNLVDRLGLPWNGASTTSSSRASTVTCC